MAAPAAGGLDPVHRDASIEDPTEGEVGEVQRARRLDVVRALAPRYAHVSKREKGQILDQGL
jgi:hypothetical protein